MIAIVSGVVVAGAGGAGLWYFMPSEGKTHPLATTPVIDALIPIGIVTTFAIGVALIISGAVSL